MLPAIRRERVGVIAGERVAGRESPAGGARRGFGGHVVGVVLTVSGGWSFCRHFGDGGSCAALVDDGFAFGEGGDEGLAGEIVDHSWVSAAGLVDQRDRVIGEQGVGAAGEFEVVFDVAGGLV